MASREDTVARAEQCTGSPHLLRRPRESLFWPSESYGREEALSWPAAPLPHPSHLLLLRPCSAHGSGEAGEEAGMPLAQAPPRT